MTLRLSLLSLGTLLLAFAGPSSASQWQSGSYGPLALTVQGDGAVHGVFAERRVGNGTPEAPQFGCLFLLEGRMEGGKARVVTWVPGETEWTTRSVSRSMVFDLPLDPAQGRIERWWDERIWRLRALAGLTPSDEGLS